MALEEHVRNTTLAKFSTRTRVNLLHLCACYPIRDRICFYSSVGAIIALSRTCRQLSHTYQDLLSTQWNIDSRLSKFVKNPRRLRLQLYLSKAVISGSFAVQYFDRTSYHDSDLDIFVQRADVEGFEELLTLSEGYQLAHTSRGPAESETDTGPNPGAARGQYVYDITRLHQVRSYTKSSTTSTSKLKIQIVETMEIPVSAILSGFYATHVVNIITWSTAYAVFPNPTFLQHKGYMLESLTHKFLFSVLRKWTKRGWEFDQTAWPEELTPKRSIRSRRRIGDQYTWMISFNTENIHPWKALNPDDDGMQGNVFEIRKLEESRGSSSEDDCSIAPHYAVSISNFAFRSPILRHTYVASADWTAFVGHRLDRATYMQFWTKLDPEDWPAEDWPAGDYVEECAKAMERPDPRNLHNFGWRHGRYFDRPKNWRYYDEDMKRWYDAWSQQKLLKEHNGAIN